MLRRLLIGAIGLMLAACTNQTPPATATLALPGVTNTPPAPATLVIVTRSAAQEARDSIVIAAPGTLVASETEDPRADVPFTVISIVRLHQGVADQLYINGDGTFNYNNVPGMLSPEQINMINQAIKNINFFGIEATFISMVPQNDVYEYAVTIERGEDTRTIVSQDKFAPAPYTAFLSDLWDMREALGVIPTSMPAEPLPEGA
jgi:hypothetical protein